MKCEHVQTCMCDYLDGHLSPRRSNEVRVHLATCPPCAGRWHSLRRAVRLTAHLGVERCPVDLRPTVSLALLSTAPPQPAARGMGRPVFAAGLAAVACVGATLFVIRPPAPSVEAAFPAAPPRIARENLHDQYALTTSLGTADGLLLSLSGRPRDSSPPAARPE